MTRRFAKVSEEIKTAFFYPSDLVNTKTTIPLRVGEERWIYTSTLRVSEYIHHYSPPLSGDSCILKADKKTIKNKIKRTINRKIGNLSTGIHIYVNSDLSSVFHFSIGVSLILLRTIINI